MSSNNHLPAKNGAASPPHRREVTAPRCRRNLFGRDEARTGADLASERERLDQKESSRFKSRWNFDPEAEAPLSGAYNWQVHAVLSDDAARNGGMLHVPATGKPPAASDERTDSSAAASFLSDVVATTGGAASPADPSTLLSAEDEAPSLHENKAKRKRSDGHGGRNDERGGGGGGSERGRREQLPVSSALPKSPRRV